MQTPRDILRNPGPPAAYFRRNGSVLCRVSSQNTSAFLGIWAEKKRVGSAAASATGAATDQAAAVVRFLH